jgi:hypothetical protein
MNSLRIEQTEDSPFVNFDTTSNTFMISGESRPENAGKFYTPVIKWIIDWEAELKDGKANAAPIAFEFKYDYFNSTSAKYIMDMILTLKKLIESNDKITIKWYSDKRDDDMLEAGKEFEEASDLKFDFIQY